MKQEDTRQKILAKALELFSVHGYDAVSVGQIAAAVGGTAADIGTAAEAKAGEKPGNEAEILGRNEAVVPENVICIMNESFADLRIFNGLVSGNSFETDGPFLSYYDSLSKESTRIHGFSFYHYSWYK